jgi:hypothetical protein
MIASTPNCIDCPDQMIPGLRLAELDSKIVMHLGAPAVSDPPSVSVMLVAVGRCQPGPAFLVAGVIMLGAMRHIRHHEPRIVLLAHAR